MYPVVKIGTPGESDISATKRRSIVPSVGDSLGSLSTFCPDQDTSFESQDLAPPPTSERRPSHSSSVSGHQRDSTAVSFIDDFPSPPNFAEPFTNTASAMPSASTSKHSTAFGQLVTGPPGAGKSTYCHGMHQVS
jgi:hypothetical protein